MSQTHHQGSHSTYSWTSSPTSLNSPLPKSPYPDFRIDVKDLQSRPQAIPTTERRSQVIEKLYNLVRDAVPDLPPLSPSITEDRLLSLLRSGISSISTLHQQREFELKNKEQALEKAQKRIQLKEQQVDSKLREAEMLRNKFLEVRTEVSGRNSEFQDYENKAEFYDLELGLETQLAKERLRGVQGQVRSKDQKLREEITRFQMEKTKFLHDLRVFEDQKTALKTAETQIQRDQETATRQLGLVDQKLRELTDLKERQERRLRTREDSLRTKEAEIVRKEGQLRDAERDLQEERTHWELQLSEEKRKVFALENEAKSKETATSELTHGKMSIERMRNDLKIREQEMIEHLRIKEKELNQREKVLSALSASLTEEQRCTQQEKDALIELKAELKTANVTPETEERVMMMREDIGSHGERLEEYAEWLASKQSEVDALEGSVLEDRNCIENSAIMLDELQVEIEKQRVELEGERSQVKEESRQIASAMRKMKEATREMEEKTRELKSRETMLSHSEAMLTERKISLEQFEKALDLRETALREEEQRVRNVDGRKEVFNFQSIRHTEYLTPRDVITPRSTEESTVFT